MKFFQSFSWAIWGRFFHVLSQAAIIIFFTKNFSNTLIGYFGIANAITSPLFQFSNMNLRTIIVTDKNNQFSFENYFNVRVCNNCISFILIVLFASFFSDSYQLTLAIVIIAFSKFIENISDNYHAFFQKNDYQDIIAKSLMLRSFIVSLILVICWLSIDNFLYILMLIYFSIVIPLIFWDVPICFKKLGFKYSIANFKEFKKNYLKINRLGFSLGLTATLTSFNSSVPRLIIAKYLSIEALGIFVPIGYLNTALGNFVATIKTVMLPRITKLHNQNKLLFKKSIFSLIFIGILIGFSQALLFYIFGEKILSILFTSESSEYLNVLIIILVSLGFTYAKGFIFSGLIVIRKHDIQPLIILTGLFFNIIFGLIMIPKMSLIGAAITILGTNLIIFFLALIYFLKKIETDFVK